MKTLTLIPETGQFDGLIDSVVDGDTLHVLLFVPITVRLHGIQVSEKGTQKGDKVKQLLTDRLTKQICTLNMHGKEKYGRTLADVGIDGIPDVSNWLIGLKLGVPWDGHGPRPVGVKWADLVSDTNPE